MINTIGIILIFFYFLIKKLLGYGVNDFAKNDIPFKLFEIELKNILKDNIVNYIKTGSAACGISIDTSDLDMAIIVHNFEEAIDALQANKYVVTKKYDHYINLTRFNNENVLKGCDTDVKIYYKNENDEFYRLRQALIRYINHVNFCDRYWLISKKVWYRCIGNINQYENEKIKFYKKHRILV